MQEEKSAAPSTANAAADGAGESGKAGKTSADYYFDSYSHFGIHEEMLKDSVRTRAYQRAILGNKHLFEGKVVLDVGCGTGILCMFAAQAGAKHVYGVDMAGIIVQARQIVEENGFSDRITLIQGKMEDVVLPVAQVDILVSEWMGYFLIYESMLDTVLYARDKYLRKGGHILPDTASLHICAIEDAEYRRDKIDFWDSVYGFDMSCIKKLALLEPLVDMCESKQVVSSAATLLTLDLHTVTPAQLDFMSHFELAFKRPDTVHALVCYFDIEFKCTHTHIRFSTGPTVEYTHWKQTVFYLEQGVKVDDKQRLKGEMRVKKNDKNPRDIDITIDWMVVGKTKRKTQEYRLR